MKKILLLVTFCISAFIGSAQDFGKTLITGSIGYSATKAESDYTGNSYYSSSQPKTTSFSVSPKIGFFVSSRWAVGVALGYDARVNKNDPESNIPSSTPTIYKYKDTFKTFQIGPFVRYYQPVGEKAAFFGQAMAAYQHTKINHDYEDPSVNYANQTNRGVAANLMPGFVYFPSKIIGLELSLGSIGYTRYKNEVEDSDFENTNSNFNIDFGLENVNIGISLYLGRTASE